MFYKVDYTSGDKTETQKKLNDIYHYGKDISTKTYHKKRLNLIHELISELVEEKAFPSMNSALDIGCNAGVCSKMISDFGFREVLGIDIEEEFIKSAKERFEFSNDRKLEYKTMSGEELSDMNRKFDFILCTEVIEHTSEPDKVVASIKNLLAPGGIAIVSLPNKINANFMFAVAAKTIAGKGINESLRQHINYPFYKSLHLFEDDTIEVKKTAGTNVFMIDFFLPVITKIPGFSLINKFDSSVARIYPAKFLSQFFFMVLRKKDAG